MSLLKFALTQQLKIMATYKYNPHRHTKIWLSNNPDVFMNLENQVRLSIMREQNPQDAIHLIYDATLLNSKALIELNNYCTENNLIAIDVSSFKETLTHDTEQRLFEFYQDEIQHLKEGGNLAVASDILRWISPIYRLGTYTDFDFPVDTTKLPLMLDVNAPLLLNIGSLKIGKKEFILANNDYIAIVDAAAAAKEILQIQKGIISRLEQYNTDFLEQIQSSLTECFTHRMLLKSMENRPETLYIARSKEISTLPDFSRHLRYSIRHIMSDKDAYLNFNRVNQETDAQIIQKLRNKLTRQLNFIKYFFFRKEYKEIKNILRHNDREFLTCLMKKELNLYLKSIIVCTTGPIEIARSLFKHYILNAKEFIQQVQPYSFHQYHLQKAFQSSNSIPLHESIIGMLRFLGVSEGELNDSSWLESGQQLQENRVKKLVEQKNELALLLPKSLLGIKKDIQTQLAKRSPARKSSQKQILEEILSCFHASTHEFDVDQFKAVLIKSNTSQRGILSRILWKQPQKLIHYLETLCHRAVIFGLTHNRKIKLNEA